MRSRAANQMQTYGPKPASIESAESAHPRKVSARLGPAKASRRPTAPACRGRSSVEIPADCCESDMMSSQHTRFLIDVSPHGIM